MIHELRIYEIFDTSKDAFHARFRDHAARLMGEHGFKIIGMWQSRSDDRLEFVYLLVWPDDATRQAAWERFLSNPEWQRIKRETAAESGALVGTVTSRVLEPTDYTPRLFMESAR